MNKEPDKQYYDFPLKFDDAANSHAIQLRMVREGSYVLDVGCHSGLMGEELKKRKGCRVVGVDQDGAALRVAEQRLDAARSIDLEGPDWAERLALEGFYDFDAIIFGDVLEHLRDPDKILTTTRRLLKHGGRVIVSVPNVANLRIRLSLLRGNFDYADSGILDRTHLRFFTISSAREMLERTGYYIVDSDVAGYTLPHKLIRTFPGMLAVQVVLAGVPVDKV
jgi:2-polyprenyl-3-methyl-5-hydroxy-6-metoxy-1,4-benzoquinol methylase